MTGHISPAGLLAAFDQAYDRRSWDGTNLTGAVRGLSIDAAWWRPAQLPGFQRLREQTLGRMVVEEWRR
jgi:hypothetical protein